MIEELLHINLIWLLVGHLIRTIGFWIVNSLKLMIKENKWTWLPFEPRYLASFVLSLVLQALTFAALDGAWAYFTDLSRFAVMAYALAGHTITQEMLKLIFSAEENCRARFS